MNRISFLPVALAVLPQAIAQANIWAQCGGLGFTGATTATSTAKANIVANSAGKLYFGSATETHEFSDTAYLKLLSDNTLFGQITPINSTNWGDIVQSLAKRNGQLFRGHSCVGYDELPDWVTWTNFSADALESILQTHCSTVVIHAWDVVNEPLNDDGTLRSFVFSESLGASYITTALVAAHAADPAAKLYINEHNIEFAGPKSGALIDLVTSLKAAGTPIHGIGVEGHFTVGQLPSKAELIANFEAFTALGVEIAITELDIQMPEPAVAILQQRADYQTVIAACSAVAGCVGVTLYDYTDKYSWIQPEFVQFSFGIVIESNGAALPWDYNLIPKPAYDGIIAGFTD
ncbi:endo-1,4-beta-xylanase C precursor [Mycena sanguinolenta]|nr:endo-1,4-beta-xylanase C precursor [Mycena sanguinolenta]